MHMQKVVVQIQGLEFPVMIRHEENGVMECETIIPIEVPGGITIHPGALIRVPQSQLTNSKKAWFTTSPAS